MRALLVALVACLVPPAWIALQGGADVDVFPFRIELYRGIGPGLALLASVWLACLPDPASRVARGVRGLGIFALLLAAIATWTPGIDLDWIRIRSPGRPALLGLLLAIGAAGLARGRLSRQAALRTALPGFALGALALVGVQAADRADLDRRIAASGADARTPDVIVLLVDTLRADALGTYGASPSPSPFLDALADRSVVFEHALAQAEWTAPSVSSLLSSLYPSSYLLESTKVSGERFIRLPIGMPWLPELLRDAGYHTAAFVKNPILQAGTRFERGFDIHEWVRGDTAERDSGQQLVDAMLVWGGAMADHRAGGGGGSFFLYGHFMDPHTQYQAPKAYRPTEAYDGPIDGGVRGLKKAAERGPTPEDLARVRALYQAEVAYLDDELRRLHDGLAARGLWSDETVVIVVSDHGEQFWEHGAFMHGDVHWENIHVPFLMRAPGLEPQRVPGPVAMLDVAPTLLDWLGIEIPEEMEGRSLAPRLRGQALASRFVVSERVGKPLAIRISGENGSLIALLRNSEAWFIGTDGRVMDEAEAPPSARPTVERLRAAGQAFRQRERPFYAEHDEDQTLEPDADTEDRLRALGYVE